MELRDATFLETTTGQSEEFLSGQRLIRLPSSAFECSRQSPMQLNCLVRGPNNGNMFESDQNDQA